MSRREFSRKQRVEIILRATDATGVICCEGCGLRLGKKPYQVDHTLAEEFVTDKSKPLTIEDGRLLGVDCCHKPKTANDIRMIRKADRARDKNTGAMKRRSRFQTSRSGQYKQKIGGEVVRRESSR